MERGWNPNVETSLNCPRCGSCNTKFCYYNNYSLTQPRYFCKACRRYWTKGGSLRNVPVGGGCRRSQRGKSTRLPSSDRDPHGFFPYRNHPHIFLDPTSSSHSHVSRNDRLTFSASKPAETNNIGSGGSIDIAQVYANFLNPQPERETRVEMTRLPPCLTGDHQQLASVSNVHLEYNVQMQQENAPQFTSDLISSYGLMPPWLGEWVPAGSEMMDPTHVLDEPQMPEAAEIEQGAQNSSDHFIGNDNNYGNPGYESTSGYGTLFRPWSPLSLREFLLRDKLELVDVLD